jgi:HEAT repeat protein
MDEHGGGEEEPVVRAIDRLKGAYSQYMTALERVLEMGDRAVPVLIQELDHKKAMPIAKALGLLMDRPGAAEAIPRLLDWVVANAPVRSEALEAVIRAGGSVVPELVKRLKFSAEAGDDEAVRHLLDLGVRLPEDAQEPVVEVIVGLLKDSNPHIREAAADAVWGLGLPQGAPAADSLRAISANDLNAAVRSAAEEALVRLGLGPSAGTGHAAQGVRIG